MPEMIWHNFAPWSEVYDFGPERPHRCSPDDGTPVLGILDLNAALARQLRPRGPHRPAMGLTDTDGGNRAGGAPDPL
jgi:hypothetical protein